MAKWIIKAYSKQKLEVIKRLRALAIEKGAHNLGQIFFASLEDKLLGYYDQRYDFIALSDELLYADEALITNIFLHELAHFMQFHIHGYTKHDAVFRSICERLGALDGYEKAKIKLKADKKKMNKIQKLLALSSSPESKEAEAALKKAQELMASTDTTVLEDDIIYETNIDGGKSISTISKVLASAAQTISGGWILINKVNNDPFFLLNIYGTLEMLELFTYIYDYLEYHINYDYQLYLKQNRLRGSKSLRISYYTGVTSSIIKRYKPKQESSDQKALITLNNKIADKAKDILYSDQKTKKTPIRYKYYEEAFKKGEKIGNEMQISKGINKKEETLLINSKN